MTMAFVNLLDISSSLVSSTTPGRDIDLRRWKTRARTGVPVKLWVFVLDATVGDTGSVVLRDATGAIMLTVLINNGPGIYNTTGELPATRAKYDLHFGGNTAGDLTVKNWSLYAIADVGPNGGELATSVGAIAPSATGEVFHSGNLSQSIGDVTPSADGDVEVHGSATPTLGAVGISAAGSVTTPAPTFVAVGAASGGTSGSNPTWPLHQAGDIALLFVESNGGETISLSSDAGFVQIPDSPQTTGFGASTRLAVYWCRATSSSMSNPIVADSGDHNYAVILTFRGCVASGNPWDVTAGDTTAASTTVTIPSDTTTRAGCLVVGAVSTPNSGVTASSWANANLTNVTELFDGNTTFGDDGSIHVAAGELAAAGPTGNITATLTVLSNQARILIALRST